MKREESIAEMPAAEASPAGQSEERFRAMAEGMPHTVWESDSQGRTLYTNSRWPAYVGSAAAAAEGLDWLRFYHPDDRAHLLAEWEKCVANDGAHPYDVEVRIRRHDGVYRWFRATGAPIRDETGAIVKWVGTCIDIDERRRAEQREEVRNRVLGMIVAGTPLPEVLDAIVRGAEEQLPGILCSILLLDLFGTRLLHGAAPSLPDFYTAAIDGTEIGPEVGSCGAAACRGERIVVADIASHPYWAAYKDLAAAAGLAACWSEPIRATSGKILGAFAIYHRQPAAPHAWELELLANAANLASIAIEHQQSKEALQLAASVYQAIGEAIMVVDADNRIAAVNPAFTRLTGYLPADVLGQNPRMLSAGRQDRQFYQQMWHALDTTGRWQGEIWNRGKDGREFAEWLMINTIYDGEGQVERRIALFSDITDQKKAEETIWRQANYDPLTLLPNRRLFHDRLEVEMRKMSRGGKALALLLIDLDRFKEVNDSLGHDAGDRLLVAAARRIQECVRATDTVARLGGDEFSIILSGLTDPDRVGEVAQAVVDALGQPFRIEEELVYVSGSVGVTLYPADATAMADLLKNADQAMYVAKNEGRNRFRYFTPAMQSSAQHRLQLIRDLRAALAARQFQIYFQPIVDLASGRIAKAEALLRWFHPERGLVNPADFIPVAEDSGLIHDIGDWVFREATRQVEQWRRHYLPRLQMSVNLSPLQFHAGDIDRAWVEHLRSLGLPGEAVVIEVTEGLLLMDRPDVTERLARFHSQGIAVAIDDFGTGYSALSYLKKFEVDYLKIDRSFVRDLGSDASDRALVEAIIVMARKLGIRVIAEGVETKEQRRFLIAAGCDYGQGYLFARPMPAVEFEAAIRDRDA